MSDIKKPNNSEFYKKKIKKAVDYIFEGGLSNLKKYKGKSIIIKSK